MAINNRKAHHDYTIIESLETGIVLTGSEVKAVRAGQANFKDSFAQVKNGQLELYNLHISRYQHDHSSKLEPTRPRVLLVKKKQLNKLIGAVKKTGYSLVPLKIYNSKTGYLKVELALVQGKKNYDKRATIKAKEWEREKQRLLKKNFNQ